MEWDSGRCFRRTVHSYNHRRLVRNAGRSVRPTRCAERTGHFPIRGFQQQPPSNGSGSDVPWALLGCHRRRCLQLATCTRFGGPTGAALLAAHIGIEDSVAENRQETLQGSAGNWRALGYSVKGPRHNSLGASVQSILSIRRFCGCMIPAMASPGQESGLSFIARLKGLWPSGERASRPEKNSDNETRVRGADGEYRWKLHCKVPLRGRRGNNLTNCDPARAITRFGAIGRNAQCA
jgi:hypothetical protein